MKRVLYLVPFASLLALTVACTGDDDATPAGDDDDDTAAASSSSSSSGAGTSSGGGSSGASGGSTSSSGGPTPFECELVPFVFPSDPTPPLAAETYEDYLTLASELPFDVVGAYTSDVDLSSAAWDEGGKLLAEIADVDTGAITVHRLAAPAATTGVLADDPLTLAQPAELFSPSYPNYPPVLSIPGNRYVLSYTTTFVDGVAPGVAYLFEGDTQRSRAYANGFFGVVGSLRGDGTRLFYDAQGPLAAAPDASNAGGLYVQDLDGTDLAAGASFALVTTGTDNSGPVVKDGSGTIAIASQSATVNLRLVDRCTALQATGALDVPVLRAYPTTSTQSLAIVPPSGSLPGFVFHQAYQAFEADPPPPDSFATPFTRDAGNTFAPVGSDLLQPIGWGPDATGMTFVADADGYLWVAVTAGDGGHLFKLRRRVL